jgi:hypothetical protein
MKDQYFGDVNDFRKYGLLRSLAIPNRLHLGVCWMLTDSDGRTDGSQLAYLANPKKYRQNDPQLFEWLREAVYNGERRVVRVEQGALLGSTCFQSEILTDCERERDEYFTKCAALFAHCDLVFFDPDNGIEVPSTLRGRRNSRKYLYWEELCSTLAAGPSVLIYQHFIREERSGFIGRMTQDIRQRTRAAAVFSFRTPNVLFLLAAQERHAAAFRGRIATIPSEWASDQILATEHAH